MHDLSVSAGVIRQPSNAAHTLGKPVKHVAFQLPVPIESVQSKEHRGQRHH